jgi:hypothetical protein
VKDKEREVWPRETYLHDNEGQNCTNIDINIQHLKKRKRTLKNKWWERSYNKCGNRDELTKSHLK